MPHIVVELMGRCGIAQESFIPTDIYARDLTMYGGHDVKGLFEVISSVPYIGGIVALGGEVFACSVECAARMFFHLQEESQAHFAADQIAWTRFKQDNPHVSTRWNAYMPDRSHLPPHLRNTRLIANTVGGSHVSSAASHILTHYDYVSMRNIPRPAPVQGWHTVPDSVVMIRRLMGDMIAQFRLHLDVPEQYIAVQFRDQPAFTHLLEPFAKALGAMSQTLSAPIVFFRAGAAKGHDSLARYRSVQHWINIHYPHARTMVFEDLHILKITALISGAKALVSTSLHTRIIAFAYSVRRVTLDPRPKHNAFIHERDPLKKTAVSLSTFIHKWQDVWHTMNVSSKVMDPTSAEEAYYASFKAWAGLLGVHGCPRRLP